MKIDYFTEANQKLYEQSQTRWNQIKNLQDKLDTCENQSTAVFIGQGQVCERKLKGIVQNFERCICTGCTLVTF